MQASLLKSGFTTFTRAVRFTRQQWQLPRRKWDQATDKKTGEGVYMMGDVLIRIDWS